MIAEKPGEFVERRDLDGARAGELFLHAPNSRLRESAPDWSNHAFPIRGRRGDSVEVQQPEQRRIRYWCRLQAGGYPEDVIQVGCGVGADEQRALSPIGQAKPDSAGDGRLPNAPLAREEQISRRGRCPAVERLGLTCRDA